MINYLSIIDDITGRRLIIIEHPSIKKSLVIEDEIPVEVPNCSVSKLLKSWMKSVRRDNP